MVAKKRRKKSASKRSKKPGKSRKRKNPFAYSSGGSYGNKARAAIARSLERSMGAQAGALTLGMAPTAAARNYYAEIAGGMKAAKRRRRRAPPKLDAKSSAAFRAWNKRGTKKRGSKKKRSGGGNVTAAQVIKAAKSNALKTWACRGITRTGCGGSGSRVVNSGKLRRLRGG